jgi:hypothetical protein
MPPVRPCPHAPKACPEKDSHLARQWKILERLNTAPCTVKELARRFRVDLKTIRRDLSLLDRLFQLKQTIEERGRKTWRLKKRMRFPPPACRATMGLVDALVERVAALGDLRLTKDMQAIRRRLGKKCP